MTRNYYDFLEKALLADNFFASHLGSSTLPLFGKPPLHISI